MRAMVDVGIAVGIIVRTEVRFSSGGKVTLREVGDAKKSKF